MNLSLILLLLRLFPPHARREDQGVPRNGDERDDIAKASLRTGGAEEDNPAYLIASSEDPLVMSEAHLIILDPSMYPFEKECLNVGWPADSHSDAWGQRTRKIILVLAATSTASGTRNDMRIVHDSSDNRIRPQPPCTPKTCGGDAVLLRPSCDGSEQRDSGCGLKGKFSVRLTGAGRSIRYLTAGKASHRNHDDPTGWYLYSYVIATRQTAPGHDTAHIQRHRKPTPLGFYFHKAKGNFHSLCSAVFLPRIPGHRSITE
ncbi:hypothetical protein F5146DRAFT_1152527 [Armillaria mellea]|nr:hypothetical protein F5146DRAFT_1152527 [Armillaria mellea]